MTAPERQRLGTPRLHLRATTSTSDRARELAQRGAPHGTIVSTAEQSAGRGRQGRTWSAPSGQALLFSLVLRRWPALLPLAASAQPPSSVHVPVNDVQDLSGAGFRLTFGYGSTVGFVAGGLLLVLAVPRSYPASVDRSRMLFRLGPMLACVAYLAFVLVPRWGVLPLGLQRQLRFAPISWLTISGALLAVWLLREWAGRVAADSENSERLVMLPLALAVTKGIDPSVGTLTVTVAMHPVIVLVTLSV